MNSLERLKNTLQALDATISSFPVCAASAREPSIEEKLKKTVSALLLSRSQLLTLKAKVDECKLPKAGESVNEDQLISVLEEYEKTASKFTLQKALWDNSITANTINNILCGKVPLDEETSTDWKVLKGEYENLKKTSKRKFAEERKSTTEEQTKVSQQIMRKKEELKAKMYSYKLLLDEKRELKKNQMVESGQLNQKQMKKLEKLNVMRQLMIHLLTISQVDLLKHPQWTELLLDVQKIITLKDLD
ncbi:hypothetical protein C0J52_11506 [Blattella germanica]|nr:hypothetical protein C0J52_11506 [Blattella germanica]